MGLVVVCGGGGRGSSCVGVRASVVAGGGSAAASGFASVEGVRVALARPDRVGVGCAVVGAGDRAGVADR
jgi:hypothetical protein